MLSAGGLAARAVLQAMYLIVVSRWLGVEGYGVFGASIAAAVLLAPLAAWGAGYVYMDHVIRRPASRQRLWRHIAAQALVTGMMLALVVVAGSRAFLDAHLAVATFAAIAVAELVALPMAQLGTTVLLALQRPGLAAINSCAVPAARLLGALALLAGEHAPSLHAMALSHAATSLMAGLATMLAASCAARSPRREQRSDPVPMLSQRLREGAPFALGALLGLGYLEIDKVLILELAGPAAAGAYSAAFRVATVLFIPVTAMLANALPRLIAAHHGGRQSNLLRRVVQVALAYAALGAFAAWASSPLMPYVFGAGFENASRYLAMLALWLPFATLHQCGATALLANGNKGTRMAIESLGVCVVVIVNCTFLPVLGASAAVLALFSAEVCMSALCWWSYRYFSRRRPELPASTA